MSLEARIELLTAAVIELTAAIGGMQAPAEVKIYPNGHADGQTAKSAGKSAATEKATSSAPVATESKAPNAQSESATSEPSTASAPTGESSSPALDYAKDVKPITIRVSKEKGRDTAIAVLQRFGVKGAQDLDAAQWAEYIAHCEKVLAGGEV